MQVTPCRVDFCENDRVRRVGRIVGGDGSQAAVALQESGAHVELQYQRGCGTQSVEIDRGKRAGGQGLIGKKDLAREIRCHFVFEETGARPGWVAAADPDEVELGRTGCVARCEELERLTGTKRPWIAVPGDLFAGGGVGIVVGAHFERFAFQVS